MGLLSRLGGRAARALDNHVGFGLHGAALGGAGGGAIGAGISAAGGGDPLEGAMLGAGIGAGVLGIPAAITGRAAALAAERAPSRGSMKMALEMAQKRRTMAAQIRESNPYEAQRLEQEAQELYEMAMRELSA